MTLNKHDFYLLQAMERMSNTGYKDQNPRAKYKDGTPSHTLSIRGGVYEVYDLQDLEFPITETRPIAIKSAINEVLAFYQDQTNRLEDFEKRGLNWWKEWALEDGTIGARYGATVKRYNQMDTLLHNLEHDPFSKRHIIDLWQLADFKETEGLLPCAFLTMWTVSVVDGEKYLDLTLVQRSSDALVAGTGINQIQYVALQMMVAKHLGIKAGLFEYYRKNFHFYDRHEEQVVETIKRLEELRKREFTGFPRLQLDVPDKTNFYDIKVTDFKLIDYEPIRPQMKFDLGI